MTTSALNLAPDLHNISKDEQDLVAKFKEMFPKMVKERKEGGWERLAMQNKFTAKTAQQLQYTFRCVKIGMIQEADKPTSPTGMMTFDHWYAMILAEFERRRHGNA